MPPSFTVSVVRVVGACLLQVSFFSTPSSSCTLFHVLVRAVERSRDASPMARASVFNMLGHVVAVNPCSASCFNRLLQSWYIYGWLRRLCTRSSRSGSASFSALPLMPRPPAHGESRHGCAYMHASPLVAAIVFCATSHSFSFLLLFLLVFRLAAPHRMRFASLRHVSERSTLTRGRPSCACRLSALLHHSPPANTLRTPSFELPLPSATLSSVRPFVRPALPFLILSSKHTRQHVAPVSHVASHVCHSPSRRHSPSARPCPKSSAPSGMLSPGPFQEEHGTTSSVTGLPCTYMCRAHTTVIYKPSFLC